MNCFVIILRKLNFSLSVSNNVGVRASAFHLGDLINAKVEQVMLN